MTAMISFPHLGVELAHVRSGFSIFGFEISWFGIFLGLAVLVGTGVIVLEALYTRQQVNTYLNLTFFAVIAALIGGRVYYVLPQWTYYKKHFGEIWNIRSGGMGFYGALFGGLLIICLYGWFSKERVGTLLDTIAVGLAAGQAVGIWGCFFENEYFGEYTDRFWAMRLPLEQISLGAVTDKMKNHIDTINGERVVQVSPLVFWMFLWCIVVFTVLFFHRFQKKFEGEAFLVYMSLYSFGSFWLEFFRADALKVNGWKITQILAAILTFLSIGMILYIWSQSDRARMRRMREREAWKSSRILKKGMSLK